MLFEIGPSLMNYLQLILAVWCCMFTFTNVWNLSVSSATGGMCHLTPSHCFGFRKQMRDPTFKSSQPLSRTCCMSSNRSSQNVSHQQTQHKRFTLMPAAQHLQHVLENVRTVDNLNMRQHSHTEVLWNVNMCTVNVTIAQCLEKLSSSISI